MPMQSCAFWARWHSKVNFAVIPGAFVPAVASTFDPKNSEQKENRALCRPLHFKGGKQGHGCHPFTRLRHPHQSGKTAFSVTFTLKYHTAILQTGTAALPRCLFVVLLFKLQLVLKGPTTSVRAGTHGCAAGRHSGQLFASALQARFHG